MWNETIVAYFGKVCTRGLMKTATAHPEMALPENRYRGPRRSAKLSNSASCFRSVITDTDVKNDNYSE